MALSYSSGAFINKWEHIDNIHDGVYHSLGDLLLYMAEGEQNIEVANKNDLTVCTPYNDHKDLLVKGSQKP